MGRKKKDKKFQHDKHEEDINNLTRFEFIEFPARFNPHEDLDKYHNELKTVFHKYILSKELGTITEGLHYHLNIHTSFSRDTVKRRIQEVTGFQYPRFRIKETRSTYQSNIYILKDGLYRYVGFTEEEVQDMFKKSTPKVPSMTQKKYLSQLTEDFLQKKLNLFQVSELFDKYRIKNNPMGVNFKQKEDYLKTLMLQEDETFHQEYTNYTQNKILNWKESVIISNKFCEGFLADGFPCHHKAKNIIKGHFLCQYHSNENNIII